MQAGRLGQRRPAVSRRHFLELSAAGAFSLALPRLAAAKALHPVDAPVAIEVNARPIPAFDPRNADRLRFGALEYRSGLVLTSPFRGFGGLSGWRLDQNGERFLAISDQGTWFTGRILYSGRAMVGLAEVEAAPMLGPDGAPIAARGWYDSESIARDGTLVYVGLERVNQLLRFDFAQGATRARAEVVELPAAARRLPNNKGLEGLVVVPAGMPLSGTLIALSERGLDRDGNLIAFLIGGPQPGQFSIRRTDKFDISDAALLASGELLILERKFSWFEGVAVRIRSIPLNSIKPGALVDGPALFHAEMSEQVDNMEGIDAHVSPAGETILTMVSDDNFSMLQRTLLLQFALVE